MSNKFLKGHDKPFFEGFIPLKPITYTIVIVYNNNHLCEIHGIEKPFAYMAQINKNPTVKYCYIKE
jgi:hypothetical protein